jgi:hypothetical protein
VQHRPPCGRYHRAPSRSKDLPLIKDAAQLADARRAWLDSLRRQHQAHGSAQSALELARGEWRCGEYADSLLHFEQACAAAPGAAEMQHALLNATSMLGLLDRHASILSEALRRFPTDPMLHFHAARSQVPSEIPAARERLLPFSDIPMLRQYADALSAVERGVGLASDGEVDPHASARSRSLDWVQRHRPPLAAHAGHPTNVLLQAIALAPATGLTLECGVYFGRSLQIIAARSESTVHGFDSFQGLPEAWNAHEGAGSLSTAGRIPEVADNVRLHRGWFEDTLPGFFAAQDQPIRLLHVDCDLYSSTMTVLDTAAPHLIPGSIVAFDDLLGYPGFEAHELRVLEEFTARTGMRWEIVAACLLGREVAIRILAT